MDQITSAELSESLTYGIHLTQTMYFTVYFRFYSLIRYPLCLNILQLFIDDEGINRVGGRLRNFEINVNQKCPVLLPKKCILTDKLIRHFYLTYLYMGPQLLSSLLA